MLTLLNGPRSIHLRSISRSILDTQKIWNFKDYTVKYRDGGFIVFDSNKNNVYCNNPNLGKLNHDILMNCSNEEEFNEKSSIIDEINDFNFKIEETIKNNHFIDSWPNTDQSFLFPVEYRELLDKLEEHNLDDTKYEDILKTYYNNSSIDDIWTGRFSVSFIEKIRNRIGSENLTVINFVRNPSSCMFTNSLSYSGNIKILEQNNIQPDEEFLNNLIAENPRINQENLTIFHSVLVSKLPGVINVSYEDYLKKGKFALNGIDVPLPNFIKNYNNIISEYEFSIYNSNLINQQKLNEFNEIFLNIKPEYVMILQPFYDAIRFIVDCFDPKKGLSVPMDNSQEAEEKFNHFVYELERQISENITQVIPKNIFQELNYSPLTIEQIINK